MFKWVESPLASALFRFTSWIFLCLAGLFAFVETPWFHRLEMVPSAVLLARVLGGVLGVIGAVTGLILWVGMAYSCARRDRSRFSAKVLWFILFFVAGPFGSAAYYFFVYKKQGRSG